ncbi:hypothetical protein HK102_005097, partial [Quaeritorhiza haematococci]
VPTPPVRRNGMMPAPEGTDTMLTNDQNTQALNTSSDANAALVPSCTAKPAAKQTIAVSKMNDKDAVAAAEFMVESITTTHCDDPGILHLPHTVNVPAVPSKSSSLSPLSSPSISPHRVAFAEVDTVNPLISSLEFQKEERRAREGSVTSLRTADGGKDEEEEEADFDGGEGKEAGWREPLVNFWSQVFEGGKLDESEGDGQAGEDGKDDTLVAVLNEEGNTAIPTPGSSVWPTITSIAPSINFTSTSTPLPERDYDCSHSRGHSFDFLRGDLVVLGGYYGSFLTHTPTQQKSWLSMEVVLNWVKNGAPPPSLPFELQGDEEDVHVPSGIFDRLGMINVCGDLLRELKSWQDCSGGRFRLHTFAYDWRREAQHASMKLEQFLDDIFQTNGNKPVIVVAHSMGCLVALSTLNRRPDLFRGCFFAGPPFGSVPLIFWPLRHGAPFMINRSILNAEQHFGYRSSYVFLPRRRKKGKGDGKGAESGKQGMAGAGLEGGGKDGGEAKCGADGEEKEKTKTPESNAREDTDVAAEEARVGKEKPVSDVRAISLDLNSIVPQPGQKMAIKARTNDGTTDGVPTNPDAEISPETSSSPYIFVDEKGQDVYIDFWDADAWAKYRLAYVFKKAAASAHLEPKAPPAESTATHFTTLATTARDTMLTTGDNANEQDTSTTTVNPQDHDPNQSDSLPDNGNVPNTASISKSTYTVETLRDTLAGFLKSADEFLDSLEFDPDVAAGKGRNARVGGGRMEGAQSIEGKAKSEERGAGVYSDGDKMEGVSTEENVGTGRQQTEHNEVEIDRASQKTQDGKTTNRPDSDVDGAKSTPTQVVTDKTSDVVKHPACAHSTSTTDGYPPFVLLVGNRWPTPIKFRASFRDVDPTTPSSSAEPTESLTTFAGLRQLVGGRGRGEGGVSEVTVNSIVSFVEAPTPEFGRGGGSERGSDDVGLDGGIQRIDVELTEGEMMHGDVTKGVSTEPTLAMEDAKGGKGTVGSETSSSSFSRFTMFRNWRFGAKNTSITTSTSPTASTTSTTPGIPKSKSESKKAHQQQPDENRRTTLTTPNSSLRRSKSFSVRGTTLSKIFDWRKSSKEREVDVRGVISAASVSTPSLVIQTEEGEEGVADIDDEEHEGVSDVVSAEDRAEDKENVTAHAGSVLGREAILANDATVMGMLLKRRSMSSLTAKDANHEGAVSGFGRHPGMVGWAPSLVVSPSAPILARRNSAPVLFVGPVSEKEVLEGFSSNDGRPEGELSSAMMTATSVSVATETVPLPDAASTPSAGTDTTATETQIAEASKPLTPAQLGSTEPSSEDNTSVTPASKSSISPRSSPLATTPESPQPPLPSSSTTGTLQAISVASASFISSISSTLTSASPPRLASVFTEAVASGQVSWSPSRMWNSDAADPSATSGSVSSSPSKSTPTKSTVSSNLTHPTASLDSSSPSKPNPSSPPQSHSTNSGIREIHIHRPCAFEYGDGIVSLSSARMPEGYKPAAVVHSSASHVGLLNDLLGVRK